MKIALIRQKRLQEQVDLESFLKETYLKEEDPPPNYELPPSYEEAVKQIQKMDNVEPSDCHF